eukprot:GHRQ01019864.1.p2 GENE.GHRQ01019864.1~~GHRQ01019864.1.p2  ORF type:complete len:105 (-),score=1.54 GHRQ01019864.1:186-500(-)
MTAISASAGPEVQVGNVHSHRRTDPKHTGNATDKKVAQNSSFVHAQTQPQRKVLPKPCTSEHTSLAPTQSSSSAATVGIYAFACTGLRVPKQDNSYDISACSNS